MVKLYNSRGLLEPPEANVAIGRAGAEMGGIEMDGRTDDDGDMWHFYWRSTIVGLCADCQKKDKHIYVYIYIYMLAYMHVCSQTCIHAYMHTCIHASIYPHRTSGPCCMTSVPFVNLALVYFGCFF